MNENEIAAPVRRVALDTTPIEFDHAVAHCDAFRPTNVVRETWASPSRAFAVEHVFDATDDMLDAYLAHFDLPADERDDVFIDV